MSRKVGLGEDIRGQLAAHLGRLEEEGVWGLEVKATSAASTPDEAASTPAPDRESLEEIAAETVGCVLCKLSEGRTNVVFGVGPARARLMFIGEGPGRDEDLQGEPFVGRAGQMLNRIIKAMGLRREDVYIANAVKCRPPRNRNPESDELEACGVFLQRQVEAIRPEIIVLLGRVAAQSVLQTGEPLGRLRGSVHEWLGIPVVCTYHPAYLLRNPADKGKTWQDVQVVMERLAAP
ncbi:MAG TPA: uracil-DNA glycosylase [Acidobacteriota bacterium]|nr:uracil-DNA glycosylase [Acidobacteriota bacterium]